MSRRRTSSQTIGEARYPDTPDFVELAKIWNPAATSILLNLIWQGYDLCFQEILSRVDVLPTFSRLFRTKNIY